MLRGHTIYVDDEGTWRYTDSGQPTAEAWETRPCGLCGEFPTPDGHDPCLGVLPGVRNACCGHGDIRTVYVQFEDGKLLRGREALVALAVCPGKAADQVY